MLLNRDETEKELCDSSIEQTKALEDSGTWAIVFGALFDLDESRKLSG
jgi:hypothetical protein